MFHSLEGSPEIKYANVFNQICTKRGSDKVRERIPHTWSLPMIVFFKSNVSYAAIFREATDWLVVMT